MTDTTEKDGTEPTELDILKQRADDLGIPYSPNIGLNTLRTKVNEKLAPSESTEAAAPLTSVQRHQEIIKKATRLIRCRITNLNPNKKHSEGEYMRTGNRIVKTIGRFVPFEHETHVEEMLLNAIKARTYCIVVEVKDADGKKKPVRRLRKEFQVELLDALTKDELETLAAQQAKQRAV